MFRINKKLALGTACLAVSIAFAADVGLQGQAFAQATGDLQQGFIKGPGNRVSLTPQNALSVSDDETEILPSLRGVVIVSDPQSVSSGGASADGVENRSDATPEIVAAAASAYVGQSVSLASLDRLTRDMVLAFRDAGMPVVNVVIPPQDVTNGVVQIVAVIGRLGEVTVEGNTSNPEHYAAGFPLSKGEVIEEAAVVNHLRWKSRRANRRVNAIYSPGANFGETDIAFDVAESKPWSVFFGADSSGSGSTGDYRLFAGAILNDLFVEEDEFSYQFTTTEEGIDALAAHVVQYTVPIAERMDFQLTGSYVETSSTALITNTDGLSYQLSGTLITQHDQFLGFYWDGRYGFDYKRTNNDLDSGGGTVQTSSAETGHFYALWNGERNKGRARTTAFGGIWYSPGDMFDDNTDARYATLRQGASADYVFARGGFEHRVNLENEWTFNLEADGQIADGRLLGAELFYLGGINSVRGFQESVVRGDNGAFASVELYTPTVEKDINGAMVTVRGFGFFDAGMVSVNGTPIAGVEGDTSISGAGVGLVFSATNPNVESATLSGEVSYGWKVDDSQFNTTDDDDGQFHFRVISRF